MARFSSEIVSFYAGKEAVTAPTRSRGFVLDFEGPAQGPAERLESRPLRRFNVMLHS
jgi:hypothetical protein